MSNAENVDAIDYDALALAGDLYADHLCGNEEYEPADLVQRMATTIRTLRAALVESERDAVVRDESDYLAIQMLVARARSKGEDIGWWVYKAYRLGKGDDVNDVLEYFKPDNRPALTLVAPASSQSAEFIGMDKGSDGGCAIWSAAIHDPATGEWVVHVIGPDDVMPMPDELSALREANGINVAVTRNERQQHDPIVIAMAKKREEL